MAGLYIHIPFCHFKCSYCDFLSTPRFEHFGAYIEALTVELSLRITELSEPISTIYIGGGTPSILPVELFGQLVDGIKKYVDISNVTEFTVEANPEDITRELLVAMTCCGVNRLSMGIQSLIDDELVTINRRHSAATARRAIEIIKDEIPNFSCDLIYGLPGQTVASWRYSLDNLLEYAPPHLSAYLLSYEPGTRLYARLIAGKVAETSEDVVSQMYSILVSTLRERGYNHYEISNFALKGFEAKHNSAYWESVPYLGLGVSAHSFDGRVRRYNPSDISAYISAISRGEIYAVTEVETDIERLNDYIITRLRTSRGIDTESMKKQWGEPLTNRVLEEAQHHIMSGKLQKKNGHLFIPEQYLLIADSILRDLIIVD